MIPRLPSLQPRIGEPISRPRPVQARLDPAVFNLKEIVPRLTGVPGLVVTPPGPMTPRVRVRRGGQVARAGDNADIPEHSKAWFMFMFV